ncbi:hypothetical protein SAY87_016111 [Trapa incisa]|uniref:Ultraviolet-B receptor UVR8 n=1 Tax=Trapa incisa TaxID=236973 RepID=A0AAN7QXS0_9MYRT|nr:hypothetical protein SAY87_016111 [Trapa incisa]
MDMATNRTPSPSIIHQLNPDATDTSSLQPQSEVCHSPWHSPPGVFPLASIPSLLLHMLTSCNFKPVDLAHLEATCSFFRKSTDLIPEFELSICEVAALEMCRKRSMFKWMSRKEGEELKERSGGSWKLVLMYLLAREGLMRTGKLQAAAGGSHNVIVTASGDVYTFGKIDRPLQLMYSATTDFSLLQKISSLEGIRIIQAAASPGKTILVSDSGQVYACVPGISQQGQNEGISQQGQNEGISQQGQDEEDESTVMVPIIVDNLKEIFVVQVAVGVFLIAFLSREGRVYAFSCSDELELGHQNHPEVMEPRPLTGELENIPVVQIGAGHCYLLALAFHPNGMSVYSLGCGEGGKLGHGSISSEKLPRLINQFQILKVQPIAISAGIWHAAVLGQNGEVCTWGWGNCGCLGNGDEDFQAVPNIVQGLGVGKAIHIATGNLSTFVVLDNGQIYYFGAERYEIDDDAPLESIYMANAVLKPKLVSYLKLPGEKIVHISLAKSDEEFDHIIVLTESENVYTLRMAIDGED